LKIIFLDIDGVLATHVEFMLNRKKFHKKNPLAEELRIPYPWNKKCVEIFNQIIEETDAEIVLSSDWKLYWNINELEEIFKYNGVIKSPIDVTNDKNFSSVLVLDRFHQIKDWVTQNKPKTWIVIDDLDMSSDFNRIGFGNNFVLTKDMEGLKQTKLKEKIIKKLNNE